MIAGFSQLPPESKLGELDKLEKMLGSIESTLESLNLESNRTGKSTQHYFTQFYQAKKTYQQHKDKYQNEKNYSDLMSPSYRDFNTNASMTQREKVLKANKTLENGIQMIKMAGDQVREDQRVAEATLTNMAQQRERLLGFEKKFDSIDSFLSTARKTISAMSRRAIANKIIMAVIIVVLIASIGLIIWLKLAHNSGNNNNGGDGTTTGTTTGNSTMSTTTSTTTTTTGTTTGDLTTTGSTTTPLPPATTTS
eukprot:gene10786-12566_t